MIRVIVNGISFYTTKKRIKDRLVGSNSMLNEAIFLMYHTMASNEGVGSTIVLYDSKMKRHSFDIQINR